MPAIVARSIMLSLSFYFKSIKKKKMVKSRLPNRQSWQLNCQGHMHMVTLLVTGGLQSRRTYSHVVSAARGRAAA